MNRSACGQEAEQHAGNDGGHHRQRGDRGRLAEIVGQRMSFVVHREEQAREGADEETRQHETADASGNGEQQRLSDDLTQDPERAGTERQADCEFTLTRG